MHKLAELMSLLLFWCLFALFLSWEAASRPGVSVQTLPLEERIDLPLYAAAISMSGDSEKVSINLSRGVGALLLAAGVPGSILLLFSSHFFDFGSPPQRLE